MLNNKRLFIMPSKAGLGFLVVVILLWLTGTNFDNNVVLGLAFFLTALFVISIHHTFFNMAGLKLEGLRTAPCFLGEDGEVELQISCRKGAEKENIGLQFQGGSSVIVDLIDEPVAVIKLFTTGLYRGWYRPPRLKVISHYPLGIIRCWSWLILDLPILVYPKPISGGEMPVSSVAGADEGSRLQEQGAEDFHGFKNYEVGVSPKHIAWKHYARGQGLYSKEYASYREPRVWLDWDALEGVGKEARLSRLCYWVLKLSKTQQPYGLRLPGVSIPPARGLEHKLQVLKALALYQPRKAPSYTGVDVNQGSRL
ncbi:DUF58 domain-containing protein [Aestuariicella hydrocarbonica]|uniref:DUF58 domain-containing protein n=1 Tax=Pseudomaricurvus hydrocarbonicus TaxID=1470433 RepID=A0A9E5JRT1_9GAMM|nr:DUF58 domain-containing protein [Aestuariicella hydrocarbonica]